MQQIQITQWCHRMMKCFGKAEGRYLDATMGKGNDTLFLCTMAGETGSVLAFDIQEAALQYTGALLKEYGMEKRAQLILDGHEAMDRYAEPESLDIICFNFGYLPGGDHRIATKPSTSIAAIEKGLKLLKAGGLMSLCIYSGGHTGFAEKEAILSFLRELPPKTYTVIVSEYWNRENCPPVPVLVFKTENLVDKSKGSRYNRPSTRQS